MSQLFLVRHGQASFGAVNYDQLSTQGYQQARWLGEHFADMGIRFSQVVAGDLARQQQTAQEILAAAGQSVSIRTDSGFNEFDFHTLSEVKSETPYLSIIAKTSRLFPNLQCTSKTALFFNNPAIKAR